MHAVIDTSPLQALWRGGVLEQVPKLFRSVLIPGAVADETHWSRALVGGKKVPDLDALGWIAVEEVGAAALKAVAPRLHEAYESRTRSPKRNRAQTVPIRVAIVDGRVRSWRRPARTRSIKVPDLEVLVLAQRHRGVAILDDRRAIRAASDLGVRTATTREVVAGLIERGHVSDTTKAVIRRIERTGYYPLERSSGRWSP